LQVVAVAVIALAVWGMARSLAPDRPRATLAILAAIVLLIWPNSINIAVAQIGVIVVAGLVGWKFLPAPSVTARQHTRVPITRTSAIAAWIAFFVLLFGLPVLRTLTDSQAVALVDSFYRVGSLVFGGGHVVLPLLQAEVVPNGWVPPDSFLAGYGAAQAVPGPLFTFSAFLGAITVFPPNGVVGATLALLAIYVPSFLLLIGTLPSWGALRARPSVQSALRGINAAVVGLLLAALYQSGWSAAIHTSWDFALGVAAFGLLAFWGVPPWLVVVLTAAAGAGLTALGIK
jgi:chromate transporter